MNDPFTIDHDSDEISSEEAKFFEAMRTGIEPGPTSAPVDPAGASVGTSTTQGGTDRDPTSAPIGTSTQNSQGNQGNVPAQDGSQSGQAQNQDDRRPGFVPHQALHEERLARQGLATENATLKQQIAALGGKFEALNELVNGGPKGQQGGPAIPDPEQDIIGWAKAVAAKMAGLEQGLTRTAETTNQELAARDMQGAYERDARSYVAKVPDFFDAYNHMLRGRVEELKLLGFDQKEIGQIVANDEKDIVTRAYQRGQSPADSIYNMAKLRGYAPKSATPTTGQQNGETSNNSQNAAEEAAKKLEAIARGQSLNGSLSGGGSDNASGLTLAKIADMEEDELDVWMSKASESEKRRALGG